MKIHKIAQDEKCEANMNRACAYPVEFHKINPLNVTVEDPWIHR